MDQVSKTPRDQVREIRKLVQDASDLIHQVAVSLESLEDRLEDRGDGACGATATPDAKP